MSRRLVLLVLLGAAVKAAAQAKFASLDIDHDGTLDRHELGGLVTGAEFAAADKDNDKTIDETEYLAIVASAFQKADRDHDGTVSTAELSAPAGRKFLSLLAY
jgi:Ca2+-binding EF-hand superfamily protein